ncbi:MULTISPECIES: LutC/YkgG family protein [Marinobacter]|uniref:Lactate utilization protein n=1 Tax=Marinobacter profundi TaxID=2666256 RepID=A0A2G1UJF2_9GAMM|nr:MULTISPECIES: lactate utilization protein [Marinobacter]MBD3656955.1 lactate utilization protein [Marinobacter sp.]PHQ14549.1 lactate utilization protein [Marinobacter profundi]
MTARSNILGKLRNSLAGTTPRPDEFDEQLVTRPWQYPPAARVERLRSLMEAVHTEVHQVSATDWPALVADLLNRRNLSNLLCAPATDHGKALQHYWQTTGQRSQLLAYDRPIEQWKTALFENVEASITGTIGGIAATGSLVLWPDRHEPRLMSLVPPVHIALLKASEIHDNLYDLMTAQRWAAGLPTNALLVSGPSKTADIEQVLAYGAHGPKELIVVILDQA